MLRRHDIVTNRGFKAESVYPRMVEIRRALHRHPELAFEEERTAQTIIEELERLDIQYSYPGKGGAVIGSLCDPRRALARLVAESAGHLLDHWKGRADGWPSR